MSRRLQTERAAPKPEAVDFAERFAAVLQRELEDQIGDVLAENATLKRRLAHLEAEVQLLRADLASRRPQLVAGTYDANGVLQR
jgi:hypothetical protein